MIHPPSDDDLTPEEVAAFLALPRDAAARDQLAEARTVRALHDARLLRAPRQSGRVVRIGGAIAAAVLIFAAGAAVGRSLALTESQTTSPSLLVQQTGTAYVKALARLSRSSDTERRPGLQAGAATLRAAASSLAEIDPNDPIAHRIRSSLDVASAGPESHPVAARSVVWF